MIQLLDLDSLASIFSFLPDNHRGKSAQILKCVSKYFFHLFSVNYDHQYTDYFREVFGSMFVPKMYIQLCRLSTQSSDRDEFGDQFSNCLKRLFGRRFEAISKTEFELEFDFPTTTEEKNTEHILNFLPHIVEQNSDERQYLLDDEKHSANHDLIKQLLHWKFNSKDSLTLNNYRNFDKRKKINAFRFFKKFKFHFQLVTNSTLGETEIYTCKYFNLFEVWDNVIVPKLDSTSVRCEIEKSSESQAYGIIRLSFLNFIKYAEKYGDFELQQIYNWKELDELQKISQEGSITDLIDYLTISRNIMLHFTTSILSNNTNLIRYSSIERPYFHPKIRTALGITENLSLIPWNVFTNNARLEFSSIILYHLLEDALNISEEYLTKYRNIHNLPIYHQKEQRMTFVSNRNNFVLKFQTLEFYRTIAIIRNNIVTIPFYPRASLEGFSHHVPRDQVSTFPTTLDSVNLCCMKYCTFNTITAPLWCVPCCCWWGAMTCCCLYPLCYQAEKLLSGDGMCGALVDSKHRCMSCFDCDVCLFVSANSLCYPCFLLKARVTDGPFLPEARSWTIADDKIFGNNNNYCNIL